MPREPKLDRAVAYAENDAFYVGKWDGKPVWLDHYNTVIVQDKLRVIVREKAKPTRDSSGYRAFNFDTEWAFDARKWLEDNHPEALMRARLTWGIDV